MNAAAYDFVYKLVARIRVWLNAQPAVAVLTGAAGLLLVPTLRLASDGSSRDMGCESATLARKRRSLLKTLREERLLRLANCRNEWSGRSPVTLNLISIGRGLLQERKECPNFNSQRWLRS